MFLNKMSGTKIRSSSRKKITISFVIRDVDEKVNRAGVNAVRLDPTNRILYTAGRDSIIRMWDIKDSDRGKVEVRDDTGHQTCISLFCNLVL